MTKEPKDWKEVLGIMRDGGHQLCDYAGSTWTSGKYGSTHEARYAGYRRWQNTKEDISRLYRILRHVDFARLEAEVEAKQKAEHEAREQAIAELAEIKAARAYDGHRSFQAFYDSNGWSERLGVTAATASKWIRDRSKAQEGAT